MLEEGWYLMTTQDIEQELARLRPGGAGRAPSGAIPLSVDEALAYRDAGNLPDDGGRTLRLVLRVTRPEEARDLSTRRLMYEPDYHEPPAWRVEGSKPVTVVCLRDPGIAPAPHDAWWDDPELAELEREWRERGSVAGLKVPGAYRGFVYKTVLALRSAGATVTPDAVADSIARWLPVREAERIRAALKDA